MKKAYYTIAEVVALLQQINPTYGVNEIISCTQENLIRPVIYINSLKCYANSIENNILYVLGFCYLTSYFAIDDSIGFLNNLLRESMRIDSENSKGFFILLKNKILGNPQISCWQTNSEFFKTVPKKHLRLTSSCDYEGIYAFTILYSKWTIHNIRISHDDLHLLKKFCIEQLAEAEAEKTSLKRKLKRSRAGRENAKKAASARRENATDWKDSRSGLLVIAKENPGEYTANKLAELGVSMQIAKRHTTTIAKDIRQDAEFTQYLKKRGR